MKPLPSEDLKHVLDQTRPFWEKARGHRIFLSGATGFFGAWLLETLAFCDERLKLGLSATVLSRDPKAFLQRMPHLGPIKSIRFVKGDIRDFVFPDDEFDSVIHGATSTSLDAASRPAELMSTLIRGTERMIQCARERHAKRFLFISSGAVYGRQPASLTHTPEDFCGGPDWLDPNSVYGEGKRVSEQMCSIFARESGVHVTMARCFTLLGPHLPLDQHFAIGNFIRDALAGRNIAVKGDGSPIRSYIYAADLTVWLWTLLLRADEMPTNPFALNVGSGEPISIADLAVAVTRAINPTLKVEIASTTKISERQPRYVPDVQKARDVLGLTPLIGLEEAIRRTAEWSR
ncbi:MAG TPA: NAD(P)-dependent oxidoreductase [Terracidiphilus sp.]|jgi:dTDP-glucose 4,6-dehydratase|nr:NAD(P)-dependent oxidoreductase [Terracidiphilus sp.]